VEAGTDRPMPALVSSQEGWASGSVRSQASSPDIDLDDADLDFVASTMEALSLPPSSGGARKEDGEAAHGGHGGHIQN